MIVFSGYPKGFTCLDKIEHARTHPEKYTKPYRKQILAGDGVCEHCRLQQALGTVRPLGKSIVRRNAEEDPSYCPYCMRCQGLVRMKKTDVPFLWRCSCGAIGDDRTPEEIAARPNTPSHPYASGEVPDEGDTIILRPRTAAPYKRKEEATGTVRTVDIPDLPEVIEVDWHTPAPMGFKDDHVYVRDLVLVQRACHEG
jgi:hypothetical protein